jgi:hypothetical protein
MLKHVENPPLFWLGIDAEGADPGWSDEIRRKLKSRHDRQPEDRKPQEGPDCRAAP